MEKDAKKKMQDLFLQYNFTIIQMVTIFAWYIVVVMSLSVHILAYLKK